MDWLVDVSMGSRGGVGDGIDLLDDDDRMGMFWRSPNWPERASAVDAIPQAERDGGGRGFWSQHLGRDSRTSHAL